VKSPSILRPKRPLPNAYREKKENEEGKPGRARDGLEGGGNRRWGEAMRGARLPARGLVVSVSYLGGSWWWRTGRAQYLDV